MRSFLGLGNYFKRFVQGYSKLVEPLVRLTKSSVKFDFQENVVAQQAFENLKWALSHAPVLALPDFSKPYEVVCDASGFGCGAVLLQGGKPLAFHTYKFNRHEQNYHPGEQELLAVIVALKKWRCYLEGAVGVTVVTDHKPNTYLDTKAPVQLSRRQVRWNEFLSRFDFTWEYRKGCKNVADPLSRSPALLTAMQTSDSVAEGSNDANQPLTASAQLLKRIAEGYASDEWFSNDRNTKTLKWTDEGFWKQGGMIVVPDVGNLRKQCISLLHDSPFAGHLGRDRTCHLLRQTFWWPTLYRDVEQFVATCDFCQRNKASNRKPAGLLQPLPIPEFRWESVSMDLITDLPRTKAGHTAIVVFVDRLSKMVHFAPAWTDMGTEEFAQIFLREIFSKHGLPKSIVSDRDARFTSAFFSKVCALLGVEQCLSTAYHPQTDGQTERANRTLEDMLRHFVSPSQDDWDVRLPCCEFAVNNAWNAATDNTPFFLNYGENPRTPVNIDVVCQLPAANTFVGRVKDAVTRARDCLKAAQSRMKKNEDAHRREETFEVGEFALLSTQNLRLSIVGTRKLLPKFLGPFEVIQKVGAVAYKLCLPATMKAHPVFHVSLLRKYKDGGRQVAPPPAVLLDGEIEYEVEQILAHVDKSTGRREYLVKWKGYGPEENTWVKESDFANANEVLQDYLLGLQPSDAPVAARVGKLAKQSNADVEGDASVKRSDRKKKSQRRPGF